MLSKVRSQILNAVLGLAVLLGLAGVASATDPTPTTTIANTGVDVTAFAASFATGLGVAVAAGVALMFAMVIISVGVRWIMAGGKKR